MRVSMHLSSVAFLLYCWLGWSLAWLPASVLCDTHQQSVEKAHCLQKGASALCCSWKPGHWFNFIKLPHLGYIMRDGNCAYLLHFVMNKVVFTSCYYFFTLLDIHWQTVLNRNIQNPTFPSLSPGPCTQVSVMIWSSCCYFLHSADALVNAQKCSTDFL